MVENNYENRAFDYSESPRKEMQHARASVSGRKQREKYNSSGTGKAQFKFQSNDTFDQEVKIATAGCDTLDLSSEDEDTEETEFKQSELILDPSYSNNQWMINRGKAGNICFGPKQIETLRACFNDFDKDGSGQIGIDELEDPLIALGIADTREEVDKILSKRDNDKSGQMEFSEFLGIIQSGSKAKDEAEFLKKTQSEKEQLDLKDQQKNKEIEQLGGIFDFFQGISSGELKKGEMKDVPFSLYIQAQRRRGLLEGLMGKGEKKKVGSRIINNFKNQIEAKEKRGSPSRLTQMRMHSPEQKKGAPADINDLQKILDGTYSTSFK